MPIRNLKPNTPSSRGTTLMDYRELDNVEPLASLTAAINETAGRNNTGRITCRHKGGGVRRRYRIIDFKRNKFNVQGTVEYLEYDPNRTSFIARILYADGERRYILAPAGLKKGAKVFASQDQEVDVKPGNAMPLTKVPFGTVIHNIEMKPGKGGQMARSAGASVQLLGRVDGYAQLKLPSGEMRRVPETCMASVGAISNADHFNTTIGKAGRKRWISVLQYAVWQ